MSEAEKIQFELVSPEKKLFSEPVNMVVVPGEEGEMGVGKDHASFVVSLKPGVVSLYKESLNQEPQKVFIAGGFADVTGETCTVLAEEAIYVKDLDVAELTQKISDLEEDLGLAQELADQIRITRNLNLAKAKLAAAA